MSELENQKGDALMISAEVARMLIALGVDWNDDLAMRELAREALAFSAHESRQRYGSEDVLARAKVKLFGLAALMLRTMEEGAELGEEIHGSDVWKAFSRALWAEKNAGEASFK